MRSLKLGIALYLGMLTQIAASEIVMPKPEIFEKCRLQVQVDNVLKHYQDCYGEPALTMEQLEEIFRIVHRLHPRKIIARCSEVTN